MKQNNVEYIRHRLSEYNAYLAARAENEALLTVLTAFVVLLQKLSGCKNRDIIRRECSGEQVSVFLEGKEIVTDPLAEHLIRLIGYDCGYLTLEQLKRDVGYRYLHSPYYEDLNSEEELKFTFAPWAKEKLNRYRNCKFDRKVYVVNDKVFYADRELTEDEIAYLHTIKDPDQDRYDLDHLPNGSFCCW